MASPRKTRAGKGGPARPPAPLPEPPTPATLLVSPRRFAAQLQEVELLWWRYVWVPVVSGLLGGLAYTLLVRHAAAFAAAHSEAAAPNFATYAVNTLGTTFLAVFVFVLMWGFGRVGSGLRGRAAEVYGASFALLPPLYLLILVVTLLTPAAAFVPDAASVAGLGSDPRVLERAALAATAQTSAGFGLIVVTLLGTAAQFGFVYAAFRHLTERPVQAVMGTLLPLLPALIIGLIGVSPLLFAR
ncbi:hypothetical protein [Deinococcus radiopugnans]|uniref:Yip1 domain-containing protein n=1 Tax=Deinococcus radiopugnans ATCC 19172 TaxID=585398 RepID=A0ABR6NU18_9DEIO|nr:hypothetical protein [Deinococcus radiopugnans]MBB6017540.1 hypothetical protein [Deinococcus radiopugnans ATCC 19172]